MTAGTQRGHRRFGIFVGGHGERAGTDEGVDLGTRRGMEAPAHDENRSLKMRSGQGRSGSDAGDRAGRGTDRRRGAGQQDIRMRVPERGQPFEVGIGGRIAHRKRRTLSSQPRADVFGARELCCRIRAGRMKMRSRPTRFHGRPGIATGDTVAHTSLIFKDQAAHACAAHRREGGNDEHSSIAGALAGLRSWAQLPRNVESILWAA